MPSRNTLRDCRRDPSAGVHLRDDTPPEFRPFDIGGTVAFLLTHCRDARWDIVGRAMRVMEDGFGRTQAQPLSEPQP